MTTALPTFFEQLGRAWKLFIDRWGVAVMLEILMIVPALLMVPLTTEYLSAIVQGVDTNIVLANSAYAGEFLFGFFGSIFFGILGMTAMMIAFASKKKLSLMVVLTSAVKRYIPVLYTSILSGLAVAVAFIPAEVLNYWYVAVRGTFSLSGSGLSALDTVIFVAYIALLIPAFIVSIWVMYAPLAVALQEVSGGFTALLFAKEIVHKHIWSLAWRIFGALILFELLTISASALPVAAALIPFILMILTIAFFVELYKELRAR